MMRIGRGVVPALAIGLGAALAAGVLATGLRAVEPGEALVVRRFGKVAPMPRGPGLHWVAPLGIDRADRVRTDEVRRLVIGLAGIPGPGDAPGAGEFLSGDLNLVKAEAVVQYRAADPVAFVLAGERREAILAGLGESALTRALSHRGIDEAMREDRVAVAREVARELARASERLGLGVAILGVSLTEIRPPEEVRPDFAAAQAARSAAEARVREAEGHADRVLAAASSEAQALLDRAHALALRAGVIAEAKADRFRTLAAELRRSRELTIRRLYLDGLRDVLPGVGRTVVLAPDEPLDLSILGPRTGETAGTARDEPPDR